MINRYEQVALTYLRHWQFWAFVAAWAAMFPLLDVLPAWWQRVMVFISVSLMGAGAAAVMGDAKQQMADARAALMPNFRGPHVMVPVGLTLIALVLLPLLSHRALAVPLLGLVASVVVVTALFSLIAYFQSFPAVAVAMGMTSLMVLDPVRDAGNAMLFGERSGLALVVLAAALAVIGWIYCRLATLREGMPEYGRVLGGRRDNAWRNAGLASRRDVAGPPSPFARLQLAVTDHRLRRLGNVFAATGWRRVRHWKVSGETSGTKWPAAAFIAVIITAMPVIAGDDNPQFGAAAIAFICSLVMPLFAVAATWMPRRRSLGYESTRPVARDRFVREFGLAMAADLFGWWVWLILAAVVPLFVWAPSARLDVVLPIVVLGAAEQLLAFGILVQVLRLHAPDASEGSVMMSLSIVTMPLLIALNIPIKSAGVTVTIAAGVALLGAALAYDAYHRWCEADLA